jgi:hypothetical protein
MFNQLGNLIINSTQHYIFFYALGSIFGIDDVIKLNTIGFIGFLSGAFTALNI